MLNLITCTAAMCSLVFNQFGGFVSIVSAGVLLKALVGAWLYASAGGISPAHAYHAHLRRPHVLLFVAMFMLAAAKWLATICCFGRATEAVDDKLESGPQFSDAVREERLSNADYDYEMDQFEEELDFEKAFGEALLRRARAGTDGDMPDSVYRVILESVWDGKDAALDEVRAELVAIGKKVE